MIGPNEVFNYTNMNYATVYERYSNSNVSFCRDRVQRAVPSLRFAISTGLVDLMSSQPWISHPWVSSADLQEANRTRRFTECFNSISACRSLIVIALTTVIHLAIWPLSTFSSVVSLFFYHCVIFSAVQFHIEAASTGPGYVRRGWMADKKKEVGERLQFCKICEGLKPPRAHHCQQCDRCVLKMDHHCPWINICVGHRNAFPFLKFLIFSVLGGAQSFFVLYKGIVYAPSSMDDPRMGDYQLTFTMFCMGSAASVVILVGYLLQLQLRQLFSNRTIIEAYIEEKAVAFRDESDPPFVWPYDREEKAVAFRDESDPHFVWPYDRGFANNVSEVLFEPLGNGFFFPVVEGCDQFTLSMEQILVKQIDKMKIRLFKITASSSFKFHIMELYDRLWLSGGLATVEAGQIWMMTQLTDYHVYGYRRSEGKRVKGWIPRRLCVSIECNGCLLALP
uniref:Palmitoyltransferase n=1 Tax=Steinernema glaseri TaxID=37863 RepID=A0A1I7Y7W1_9BILA